MEARILQLDDLESVGELLRGQKDFFGIPIKEMPVNPASDLELVKFRNLYLQGNEFYRSFGVFDKGELVGMLNADYDRFQPIWILRRLALQEESKGTNKDALQALMTYALTYSEKFGYYAHYNLIPAKYAKAHKRLWDTNELRKDGRYVVTLMETVKAGERPRFRYFWDMLYGRSVFPIDTVVRLSTRHV